MAKTAAARISYGCQKTESRLTGEPAGNSIRFTTELSNVKTPVTMDFAQVKHLAKNLNDWIRFQKKLLPPTPALGRLVIEDEDEAEAAE